MDLNKYTKVPLSELTTPVSYRMVLANHYWLVLDECVLFYKPHARSHELGSPQANRDPRLMESLVRTNWKDVSVEICLIPAAFLKHNCNDY